MDKKEPAVKPNYSYLNSKVLVFGYVTPWIFVWGIFVLFSLFFGYILYTLPIFIFLIWYSIYTNKKECGMIQYTIDFIYTLIKPENKSIGKES